MKRWCSMAAALTGAALFAVVAQADDGAVAGETANRIECPNFGIEVPLGPCEPWVATGCFNAPGSQSTWGGLVVYWESYSVTAKSDVDVYYPPAVPGGPPAPAGSGYLREVLNDCREYQYWSDPDCSGERILPQRLADDTGAHFRAWPCSKKKTPGMTILDSIW